MPILKIAPSCICILILFTLLQMAQNIPFDQPIKPPRRRCPNSVLETWIREKSAWQHVFTRLDKKVFQAVCQRKPVVFPFATPLVAPTGSDPATRQAWVNARKEWVPYFESNDYQTYQRVRAAKNSKRHYDAEFDEGPDSDKSKAARLKYQEKSQVMKYLKNHYIIIIITFLSLFSVLLSKSVFYIIMSKYFYFLSNLCINPGIST